MSATSHIILKYTYFLKKIMDGIYCIYSLNTFSLAIKRYFLIFLDQVIVTLGHRNCIEIVDFRVALLAIQHSYMSAISPFLCLLCTYL